MCAGGLLIVGHGVTHDMGFLGVFCSIRCVRVSVYVELELVMMDFFFNKYYGRFLFLRNN